MADIGIVGGGIAGLYCAWKLSDNKSHSVKLYECLDHPGGRIETKDLDGFKAECGPMRFELNIEPLFKQLAKDLGIKFSEFTPPRSGSAEFPKYDLQPGEMSTEHKQAVEAILGRGSHSEIVAGMFSHNTSALDLLKFGIYRIFNRDPASLELSLAAVVSGEKSSKISHFAGSFKDKHKDKTKTYDHIRTAQSLNGRPLYTLGFWNALSQVLSPGAIAKIRDTGTFYHLMPENPSASEWAIFWLRLLRPDADLSSIKAGVGTMVTRLEDKIRSISPLTIEPKITIEGVFENAATGKLSLATADGMVAPQFDHVILAIPAVPLRNLADAFPREIRNLVDKVIPFPLLKAFVVIDNPWWTEFPQPQQGAHLVPTREVHYFPRKGSKHVMIMFYTDRPATAYWHPYTYDPHKCVQVGKPAKLKRDLALQVAHLLPRENNDYAAHLKRVEQNILKFAIRDWSEPPFGAACHAWAPKVNVPKALTQLKAFSLQGKSEAKNVHICGEAYSDYQGFIEGALRSAKNVLDTI